MSTESQQQVKTTEERSEALIEPIVMPEKNCADCLWSRDSDGGDTVTCSHHSSMYGCTASYPEDCIHAEWS